MQYANVIVDHKASYEPLTYAIPSHLLAHLAVGSVVLVPIGPKTVHGVVTQFIRRLDTTIAQKLKPMKEVIYGGEFIPSYLLKTVAELHKTYGWGLNDLLFSLLPVLPKRTQASDEVFVKSGSGYMSYEYAISTVSRVEAYQKIARNKTILIICPSQSAVRSLKKHFPDAISLPANATTKIQREYFLAARRVSRSTVFIGTRNALMTPLHHIDGIIVDEPWFPGQKEERAPRLWTPQIAQSLCKARDIPLYLFSSLPWPETRGLDSPRQSLVKSLFGNVCLTPRRPLNELLTQFLADYDQSKHHLAIFLHESKQTTYWCAHCKQAAIIHDRCALCGQEPIVLPVLSKEVIQAELKNAHPRSRIDVFSSEELIQYRHFDAALVIGFDVFLAIVDFRATTYLVSLLYTIGAQAKESLFVTSHPDEWTNLMKKDVSYFTTTELEERQKHHLPPNAQAVQLSAKQKDILTKLLPLDLPSLIQVGTIRRINDMYQLSILIKNDAPLPVAWFRKQFLKVDILPNYIGN